MHCRNRTTLISHQQRRPWLANGMLDVWLHGIPLFRSVTTVVSAPAKGYMAYIASQAPRRQGSICRRREKQGTPREGAHAVGHLPRDLTRSYSTCAEIVPVIQSLVDATLPSFHLRLTTSEEDHQKHKNHANKLPGDLDSVRKAGRLKATLVCSDL